MARHRWKLPGSAREEHDAHHTPLAPSLPLGRSASCPSSPLPPFVLACSRCPCSAASYVPHAVMSAAPPPIRGQSWNSGAAFGSCVPCSVRQLRLVLSLSASPAAAAADSLAFLLSWSSFLPSRLPCGGIGTGCRRAVDPDCSPCAADGQRSSSLVVADPSSAGRCGPSAPSPCVLWGSAVARVGRVAGCEVDG